MKTYKIVAKDSDGACDGCLFYYCSSDGWDDGCIEPGELSCLRNIWILEKIEPGELSCLRNIWMLERKIDVPEVSDEDNGIR